MGKTSLMRCFPRFRFPNPEDVDAHEADTPKGERESVDHESTTHHVLRKGGESGYFSLFGNLDLLHSATRHSALRHKHDGW